MTKPTERTVGVGMGRQVGRWMFLNRRTGQITIAQRPNASLSVFLVAIVVLRIVHPVGTTDAVLRCLGFVALSVWALDEVLRGVNPFRRGLGFSVLVTMLVELVLH